MFLKLEHANKDEKIRRTILSLGTSFTRFQTFEIAEKSGILDGDLRGR